MKNSLTFLYQYVKTVPFTTKTAQQDVMFRAEALCREFVEE